MHLGSINADWYNTTVLYVLVCRCLGSDDRLQEVTQDGSITRCFLQREFRSGSNASVPGAILAKNESEMVVYRIHA